MIADSSSKPQAILERFDRKTCDCEAQVGHGVQRYRFCSLHMFKDESIAGESYYCRLSWPFSLWKKTYYESSLLVILLGRP